MTAAPIGAHTPAPAPTSRSPMRWVGVVLAASILLGGGMVMLGGLIAVAALMWR